MTELWSCLLITAGLDKGDDSKLLADEGDFIFRRNDENLLGVLFLVKKLTYGIGCSLRDRGPVSHVLLGRWHSILLFF